jgi:hypothetical protein
LIDEGRWEPFNVEFPLFWAFEKIELSSLEKNIAKNRWKRLTIKNQLKKYIHYPDEVFQNQKSVAEKKTDRDVREGPLPDGGD